MKKAEKILTLIACAFMLGIFFSPLWHIRLEAPQYPEGLDMFIWVDKITGTDEFTLQNVNILNHYVGMQAILPDSFKELEIMPIAVLFFVVTGVVTAILKRRKLLITWFCMLLIGGAVGLADFYLWERAFGNELDPNAPIKMEGMTYAPPFIGSKKMLNIHAHSYPHWGGLFFGLAVLSAGGAVFYYKFNEKKTKTIE